MDDARWQRIDALFEAALELPEDRRVELLERECVGDPDLHRAVGRLLTLEAEAGGFLEEPVLVRAAAAQRDDAAGPGAEPSPAEELGGLRVGPYRLIRSLGHGGMGTVYLARREDDYHHEVAIKLVRRSLLSHEARRRLHAERQVLARLEHPNIARLYDGGTTDDGLPYLVMERVEGLPIDLYCERHGLGVRQRLELVRQVLAAVAHAHHHLRVHCDVKPSNILVTEDGTPKLLDFGIAKLLSAEERAELALTATGLRPLTPAYASPEQILGEPITAASDLYSIGVLLYELLCGSLPYGDDGASEAGLRRSIVEADPPPPSRRARGRGGLERRLRGDLDAIVLRAIRKDPARRYPSARAFAEDLTRHLEARPVRARRGTLRYRAGRFLRRLLLPPNPRRRRERWAWAAVLTAVAGLSLLTLWLQRPPPPCRDSAERLQGIWSEAERSAVRGAFLATGLPFAADSFERVASALDRYARTWRTTDAEICQEALVRGERSPRLLDLGRLCLDGRRAELRTLIDLFSRADERLVTEAVAAVNQLGDLAACADRAELATQRLPPADPDVRRRLERAREAIEAQHLRMRIGRPVDLPALRRLETEVRQLDDPALLARLLHVLGLARSHEGGDPEAGVAHLQEALRAAIAGGDRPQQTRIYAALAKTLALRQGDFERARFWGGLATAALDSLSPGYHDVRFEVFEALGAVHWEGGSREDSRSHYRRALASARRQGDPLQQIAALGQLGKFEAEPNEQVIEIIERELGPEHPRLASALMNAAAYRAYQGDYEGALPLARRSYQLRRAAFGENHADLAFPLTLTGQILIAQDRPGEAVNPLRRALELIEPALGPTAHMVRDAHVARAEALLLEGRPHAARAHVRTAEAGLPDEIDPNHPSRRYLLRVAGNVRRETGDLDGALARHQELLALIGTAPSDTSPPPAEALWAVARTFAAAGRADEARGLFERALRSVREEDRWLAASIRASLADLLARSDPERARRLVAEARSRLSPDLPLHRELLRELEAR